MNQIYKGEVISTRDKTAVILLTFNLIHQKYKKPFINRKKVQVQNDNFSLFKGDLVLIKNSRPYSATKRFSVFQKIEKSGNKKV